MSDKIVPNKVFIWGSCCTRDAFPFSSILRYDINYTPRSSLSSLPSPGTAQFDEAINSYKTVVSEKRAFRQDFNSSWNLAEELEDTDLLIVDLLEERDGVFLNNTSQSILTVSELGVALREEINSAGYREINGYDRNDEFFEMFKKGVQDFKRILDQRRAQGGPIKLVLNEVYAALRYDNRRKCEKWAKHMNAKLEYLYDYFIKTMSPDLVVKYGPKDLIARKEGHPWGPAPFHFVPYTYEVLPRALWTELDIVTNQAFS